MDLKNKYILTTLRVITGIFFIFASIAGFIGAKAIVSGSEMPGLTPADILATTVLWNSGLVHLIKFMELVIGIMFLLNFLPALAAIFMATFSIGFIVYNAMMTPTNLPLTIIIALINIYFGYVYWNRYKPLFETTNKKKLK